VDTENIRKLNKQISGYHSRLEVLTPEYMEKTLGPGRWSGKEIPVFVKIVVASFESIMRFSVGRPRLLLPVSTDLA